MFNWVDIVIMIILVFNVFRGISLGFIRSTLGVVGYIVAGIVAKMYSSNVYEYAVNNFDFVKDLKTSISNSIMGTLKSSGMDMDLSGIDFSALDPNALNSLNLPESLKSQVMNVMNNLKIDPSLPFASNIASKLSEFFIMAIAFILVFIVIYIIFKIIVKILDAIAKLPVLNELNKLGGFLVGLFNGFLFIYMIMLIILISSPIINSTEVLSAIQSSTMGNFFYNHNILLVFIKRFMVQLSSIV